MIRRRLRHALVSILALAAPFASVPAAAGEKAPLSALPIVPAVRDRTDPPKDYGVPGLAVKEHASAARSYLELVATTTRGYCIVDREYGFHLQSSTTSTGSREMELWHLVEADGKATFERTRVELAASVNNVWAKGKTSIELRAVARSNGVTVWGFREASGDVVLLARGADGGREALPRKPDEGGIDFVTSECAFGAVRLSSGVAKSGTLAQLRGVLPAVGEGKAKVVPHFVVDGSLAKLSRDPEPVLAVTVRITE